MEVKLIKTIDGYELFTQGFLKGSTNHKLIDSLNIEEGSIRYKLSLKNCQAIERGYDLDELINGAFDNMGYHSTVTPHEEKQFKLGYRVAFREALEILGDKKFSSGQLLNAMDLVWQWMNGEDYGCKTLTEVQDKHIQSLQQTEWDVEVEMICPHPEDTYVCGIRYGCDEDGCNHPKQVPYLDADGCLILKKI